MSRALLPLLLLAAMPATANLTSTADRLRDLNYVTTQLPRLHPNFFYQSDSEAFQQTSAQIAAQIDTLSDQTFYVALAYLTAFAGDAHTYLALTNSAAATVYPQIPLRFRWLEDGPYVTAASTSFAKALGARLVRVGDFPLEEAIRRLGSIIPHANDAWLHRFAEQYLTRPGILEGLDLLPSAGPAPYTFRTLAGEEITLQVKPSTETLVPAIETQPPFLRNGTQNYWFTYKAENRLLHFKYNQCAEIPGSPFNTFADALLQTLDTNPVDTFVFDLRGNSGGNSSLVAPIINGLARRYNTLAANPRFRIYDVFDKGTFSSGVSNAADLLIPVPNSLPAQFPNVNLSRLVTSIGEPSGGADFGYGNVVGFSLPASGLTGQYSTRFFSAPSGLPALPSLLPQIAIPTRATDYFARFDPVMAAILTRAEPLANPPSGEAIAVSAASFRADRGLAPGSYTAIFGSFSQPPDTVIVADQAARVVFSATSQVNVLLPDNLRPGPATIALSATGKTLATGQTTIAPTSPALFTLSPASPSQPGAILNADGSLNTPANPTDKGQIVVLFATGAGSTTPATKVWVDDALAEVLYSGPVEGFPGLWQINARLPATATGTLPVFIAGASVPSNAVTLTIR